MSNNNFDEIVEKMKNQKDKKEAQDFLMKKLNSSQSKKLQEVMSDKDALAQLLSPKERKHKTEEGKHKRCSAEKSVEEPTQTNADKSRELDCHEAEKKKYRQRSYYVREYLMYRSVNMIDSVG